MKNIMILASLALVISPSLAAAMEPTRHAQQTQNMSNGARQTATTARQDSANQYHDRTPVAHDRGTVSTR